MVNSKSLARLRKQNADLKAKIKAESELVNLEEERIKLQVKNKQLLTQLRRSPTSKSARRTLGNIGRGLKITGKSLGKGLIRYGRFLDEKEQQANRRTKSLKKVSKKKRKSKSRKR